MRMNYALASAVLNKLHRRHEIRVGADEDRIVEQVVYRGLNQVCDKRGIYALLDSALKCATTMRALDQRLSTPRVRAGV